MKLNTLRLIICLIIVSMALTKKVQKKNRSRRTNTSTLTFRTHTRATNKYRYTMKSFAKYTANAYSGKVGIQDTCATLPAKELPNAKNWLVVGYNIMKGNPLVSPKDGSLIDAGFARDIFSLTNQASSTSDGLYFIPNGYEILPLSNSCSVALEYKSYETVRDVKDTIKFKIGLKAVAVAKPLKTSGTAALNYEYTTIIENISTKDKTYTDFSAVCNVYRASISQSAPPALSTNFIAGLATLDGKDFTTNGDVFWKFINEFGSHYLSEILIGSKFSMIVEMSKSKKEKKQSTDHKIDLNLSLDIQTQIAGNQGVNTNPNWQIGGDSTTNEYLNMISDTYITSVGAPIPNDPTNVSKWLELTKTTPMPTSYKVKQLVDLLAIDQISSLLKKSGIKDVPKIYSNLKIAYQNYCQYLKDSNPDKNINCDDTVPYKTYEKYTQWNERGTTGEIVDYNRHDVKCDKNQALNYFKLQWSGKKIRFKYKCIQSDLISSTECKDRITPLKKMEQGGGDDPLHLAEHHPKCENDYALNRWKVVVQNESLMIDYKCCKVEMSDCQTSKWGAGFVKIPDDAENLQNITAALPGDMIMQGWTVLKDGNNGVYQLDGCKIKTSK